MRLSGRAANAEETMQDEARRAEERRREEHQHGRAQDTRRGARLDDPEEDAADLRLVDGELLGELADHVMRRLLSRQHESDHRDAEEEKRDQAHQEEEREAGAHEEAVGGDEA